MKRFLKLWELLLVFLMMLIAFFNPTLADNQGNNTDNGNNGVSSSNSGDLNQNQVAVLNVEDIVGKDQVSSSSDTELETTVPATVDIVIVGPGSVGHNGKSYGNNNRIKTSNMTFVMSPDDGYYTSEVYWNSIDVTSLAKSGVLKLPDIESGVLKVRYVESQPAEEEEEPCECECPECKERGRCDGKCKCKGKGKCKGKKSCKVSTGDNDDRAMYFTLTMLISAAVFVLTLEDDMIGFHVGGGRRYRRG